MAAREFGASAGWQDWGGNGWLVDDLKWRPDPSKKGTAAEWSAERDRAWAVVRAEIVELQQLMEDDRDRYIAEIDVQADGLADYFISFIGASAARHPWTIELIGCGVAMGNVAYMFYKQEFKRVRPSTLCPGLVNPFGPPAHPAFPSGHSFLGHLIALLLLEIPALHQRYGIFPTHDGSPGEKPDQDSLDGTDYIGSPLLWLAQRLAKNRERLGCHYPSNSFASRHLVSGIWWALLHETDPSNPIIVCPTLRSVLSRATAEWPTNWA